MVGATLRSLEPGARQKVSVPLVVLPCLVAESSIGRQTLPSARLSLGPAGLAVTAAAHAG
jgi:hypothetical protein